MIGFFAAADFQFVAVGILKEKAIVSGAVIGADFRAFQILAADLAHEFCNSIYSFAVSAQNEIRVPFVDVVGPR